MFESPSKRSTNVSTSLKLFKDAQNSCLFLNSEATAGLSIFSDNPQELRAFERIKLEEFSLRKKYR